MDYLRLFVGLFAGYLILEFSDELSNYMMISCRLLRIFVGLFSQII